MSAAVPAADLHLPRIVCLHGGGVTAEVFRLQMRMVVRALAARFRLVFVDGPFFCDAGPGIVPVYEGMGPYRRWLRWRPTDAVTDDATVAAEIDGAIRAALRADDAAGADGPPVALLGFSQGAKVVASMLYEQQQRRRLRESSPDAAAETAETDYRFGVVLAGRAPLVSLSDVTAGPRFPGAADISEGWDLDGLPVDEPLQIPTVHLHGLKDAGVHLHRKLVDLYCDPRSAVVLEWDGDHRIPFKTPDVKLLCDAINKMADDCGIA